MLQATKKRTKHIQLSKYSKRKIVNKDLFLIVCTFTKRMHRLREHRKFTSGLGSLIRRARNRTCEAFSVLSSALSSFCTMRSTLSVSFGAPTSFFSASTKLLLLCSSSRRDGPEDLSSSFLIKLSMYRSNSPSISSLCQNNTVE